MSRSTPRTTAPQPDGTARPVALAELYNVKPAFLAGLAEPIFDRLRPGDLLVDDTYQRKLSARSLKLVRRIVDGGPARLNPSLLRLRTPFPQRTG